MAKFTKGHAFSADEQMTHTKLNNLVDAAEFASDAVDDSTTEMSSGAIIVKTGGVTASQLGANAVTTAKILNENVTTATIKDANVTVAKMAANSVDSTQYVDGSIDKEHLGATVISGQTELAAVPHLTEDFALISDDDVLKKISLMKYLPLPRAWGRIVGGDPPSALAAGSYGCSWGSYANGSGASLYTIELTTAMSSANYVVQLTLNRSGEWAYEKSIPTVEIVDADTFTIHFHSDYSAVSIFFVVFGTLA